MVTEERRGHIERIRLRCQNGRHAGAVVIGVSAVFLSSLSAASAVALPSGGDSFGQQLTVATISPLFGQAAAVPIPFQKTAGGFSAAMPLGSLHGTFMKKAAIISSSLPRANWSLTLSPSSYGRKTLVPLSSVSPRLKGETLSYAYKPFTDWFVIQSGALEQGITIAKRPVGPVGSPVRINVKYESNLRAVVTHSGSVVRFQQGNKLILTYGGLGALDGNGRSVPTTVTVFKHMVVISINDGHAQYPIKIDPYFFTYELTGADEGPGDWLGQTVSLSGDGSTAMVGAIGHDDAKGTVYVYRQEGSSFGQVDELEPSDLVPNNCFGISMAMNSDGSYAVIGASGCGVVAGSHPQTVPSRAYIFARDGSSYRQIADLSDGGEFDNFGLSVAITPDGSKVLISGSVAASLYTRSGSTFEETSQLAIPGDDPQAGHSLAGPVALNADAGTALVGSESPSNGYQGTVYVFGADGPTYTASQELSLPSYTLGNFGASVALSGDGNTAVVGASSYDSDPNAQSGGGGSVFVYSRQDSKYTETSKLTPSDELESDRFGSTVATTDDGSTILVGAPAHPSVLCEGGACYGTFGPGAAYIYTRGGSGYDVSDGLAAYDGDYNDACAKVGGCGMFGTSVALDANGGVSIVGAPTHNNFSGASYIYGPTGDPTATSVRLAAGTNPSMEGDALTFTATLGPAGSPPQSGTVAFWDGPPSDLDSVELGSVPVLNGQGAFTTSALPSGDLHVYADYDGTPEYAGSQQSIEQVVKPMISLSSGANPSNYGDSLTFHAEVGAVEGPNASEYVEFSEGPVGAQGSIALGYSTVINGEATVSTTRLPAGEDQVYDLYDGSETALGQVVNQIPLSISANDEFVAQGGPMPSFTFSSDGWANDEGPQYLSRQPTCTSTATEDASGNDTSPPGAYPISCTGAVDSNYTITYVAGTLTVTGP